MKANVFYMGISAGMLTEVGIPCPPPRSPAPGGAIYRVKGTYL